MSIKSSLLKAANRSLDAYAFVFARPFFRDWNAWLIQVGFRGLGVLNHRTDSLSGERHLLRSKLRMFLGKDDPVIFDVGANEGDFSAQLIEIFPRASVFAFEPHPGTFSRLSARLADKVRLKNAGLGSTVGSATLYDYGDRNGTGHASIYDHVLTAVHKTAEPVGLEIEIDTIDNFCEAHGLELIDFLKIDTEGNELEVLKGPDGCSKTSVSVTSSSSLMR
ncbi:MAG: FkbM family methyltransferase [Verrucomicrobiota bacterium]